MSRAPERGVGMFVVSPPGPGPLGVSSIVMRPRDRSGNAAPASLMELVLALLQGIGIAAAIGVRPMLPVLLAGALASRDIGLDFDGTDFAFLESWPFLLAVALAAAALVFAERTGMDERRPLVYALAAACVVLGVLEASGSLADEGDSIIPGVVLGAGAAVLGFVTARNLFTRV